LFVKDAPIVELKLPVVSSPNALSVLLVLPKLYVSPVVEEPVPAV
jgi:hypothetical protein